MKTSFPITIARFQNGSVYCANNKHYLYMLCTWMPGSLTEMLIYDSQSNQLYESSVTNTDHARNGAMNNMNATAMYEHMRQLLLGQRYQNLFQFDLQLCKFNAIVLVIELKNNVDLLKEKTFYLMQINLKISQMKFHVMESALQRIKFLQSNETLTMPLRNARLLNHNTLFATIKLELNNYLLEQKQLALVSQRKNCELRAMNLKLQMTKEEQAENQELEQEVTGTLSSPSRQFDTSDSSEITSTDSNGNTSLETSVTTAIGSIIEMPRSTSTVQFSLNDQLLIQNLFLQQAAQIN